MPTRTTRLLSDPRHYQIAVLASLLVYGLVALDFEVEPLRIAAILGTCLAVQWLGGRCAGLPAFEPRSALISGLSLCLLLRTNSTWVALGAAAVAIGSKFILRFRGKHLFNPTNFAIVAALLSDEAWVSPAQWGNFALFAFLIACLGGMVVHRALRSDVTYAFLAFYLAILLARATWLGQPLATPLHQLSNGAFLIFSFFMISDPKTTPDSRLGRLVFAAAVALGAGYVTFVLYRPNGLLLSLVATCLLVPILDRIFPGERFDWRRARSAAPGSARRDEPPTLPARPAPGLVAPGLAPTN